jgi:hypothetical protein
MAKEKNKEAAIVFLQHIKSIRLAFGPESPQNEF